MNFIALNGCSEHKDQQLWTYLSFYRTSARSQRRLTLNVKGPGSAHLVHVCFTLDKLCIQKYIHATKQTQLFEKMLIGGKVVLLQDPITLTHFFSQRSHCYPVPAVLVHANTSSLVISIFAGITSCSTVTLNSFIPALFFLIYTCFVILTSR